MTAIALDGADPLAAHRELFVEAPGVVAYLDGNSLGRPLAASVDRVGTFLREEWAGRLIRGWDEGWLDLPLAIGPTALAILPVAVLAVHGRAAVRA